MSNPIAVLQSFRIWAKGTNASVSRVIESHVHGRFGSQLGASDLGDIGSWSGWGQLPSGDGSPLDQFSFPSGDTGALSGWNNFFAGLNSDLSSLFSGGSVPPQTQATANGWLTSLFSAFGGHPTVTPTTPVNTTGNTSGGGSILILGALAVGAILIFTSGGSGGGKSGGASS